VVVLFDGTRDGLVYHEDDLRKSLAPHRPHHHPRR
jgi:hypothetical protein